MAQPDPSSWTLLFKKHKTTVLLMLPPQDSITTAKEKLLNALQSRGLKEINGDAIPDDPSEIELGVAVDRNDVEKGWTRLEGEVPELGKTEGPKRGAGKKNTLQAADIRNGQAIAFRFLKQSEQVEKKEDLDIDLELEDPGWDVIVPSLDDEDEESN